MKTLWSIITWCI